MRDAVRSALVVGVLAGLSLTGTAGHASAQTFGDEDADSSALGPPRVLWTIGVGGSLRFIRDIDFAQDRFAPVFLDAFGAFFFEGSGIRHGVGLDVSTNISEDGAGRLGVDPVNQWVFSPTYMAYLDLGEGFRIHGKAGLPLSFGPAFAPGLEVALGAVYLILAGFGVYTEAAAAAFVGSDVVHPLVTAEVGAYFDYEVLP